MLILVDVSEYFYINLVSLFTRSNWTILWANQKDMKLVLVKGLVQEHQRQHLRRIVLYFVHSVDGMLSR